MQIAIVEDEEASLKKMGDYIRRYAAERNEEIRVSGFSDGVTFLEKYRGEYDAVFMDIAMPHMDGMECAQKLRQRDEDVCLIFVTGMAQYAIRGYEVNAMDFMVKPVSYDEFSMKLDRLLLRLKKRKRMSFAVNQKDGTKVLNVKDITYIEIFNHSLVFHTEDGDYETYGKLATLEGDERFAQFVKVSPSHLVNCAYVTMIGDNTLTVAGTQVAVSRRRRKECLEKMARIYGGGLA